MPTVYRRRAVADDGRSQTQILSDPSMSEHIDYFEYLQTRSRLGAFYRRHVLYPRICKRLKGRALDVGCGIGDMLAFRADTQGVDVNPHTVAYCRERGLNALHIAVDRLPQQPSTFDSALLDNVLEHLASPHALLHEIHRVLRPSGVLVVGVPGRKGWNSDSDHKVFYDENSLSTSVSAAGFSRIETFYAPLIRSARLSCTLRQYCIYQVFVRTASDGKCRETTN